MKKLTKEQFMRARDFLRSQARTLEKAIFELEFEAGSVEAVLDELCKYQNLDGGFGQALEPDLRTPSSSALCTEMGLRYLVERDVPSHHSMVEAAVKYVLDSFEIDTRVWRVVPLETNDYPHAPWWHDDAGSLARTFNDFRVTPRAGILASLYHYAELVSAEWLTEVTEQTVADIENLETEQFGGGGDTLIYALRLAEAPGLATTIKSRLVPRLRAVAEAVVTRDPAQWGSYSAPPLKLSPTPQTLIADLMADDLQKNLDYVLEQQTPEGTWEPTWSWFGNYPTEWEQAKIEWRGILTLDTLMTLRAFGRIEL